MRLIKSLIILLCLLQLSSFAQVNYNSDITISPTGALSGTNAGWAFNGPYNLVPSGNLNGFIFSGSTPTCSASSYHTFGSFGTGWSTGQASTVRYSILFKRNVFSRSSIQQWIEGSKKVNCK